jgi:hypothetical protein
MPALIVAPAAQCAVRIDAGSKRNFAGDESADDRAFS